ncbi:HAMP domain-containing sensor histidine kinase [Dyella sp. A6]|uniref:sensor histidine kinase n=1 Tax=Dyella aluminiiresistens TaxID=3069105 RepID=UPI002E778997|nr:HAMP domain-containing sensor histidine kinase [Dyella sp. A6]
MMDTGLPPSAALRRGAIQHRLALVFGLQLAALLIACLMGLYRVVPPTAALAAVAAISVLAWLAARRYWTPVTRLSQVIGNWNEQHPDLEALQPERLPRHADADARALARGLHAFACRIVAYNQRERDFTRDASHELRTPLTVIKMSTDMLMDEARLGDSGTRSLWRIRRATRELESVVEALLILARESDNGQGEHDFVVNDVLRRALDDAREGLHGQRVTLQLDEQSHFILHGSPEAFAVLCGQLMRHASQHARGEGRVVVTVLADAVAFYSGATADPASVVRVPRGFELAVAQRISERFGWPLEWVGDADAPHTVRVRFPGAQAVPFEPLFD